MSNELMSKGLGWNNEQMTVGPAKMVFGHPGWSNPPLA